MYDHMGDIYRGLGEYAEAIEAWQQALKSLTERETKDEKADKAERIRIEKKINEAKQAQKK